MYRLIVKQIVRRIYAQLSRGNCERVVKQFDSASVFRFSGDHVMGGERRGPDEFRAWFELVQRLFPGLQIQPLAVVVNG